MNKYQEAILEIKKMNCNITEDWNCEICTHQKVCAYYLPCKTLQKLVDKETPKKPIKKCIVNPYDYDEQGVNKNKILQCPNCKFVLLNEYECIDYTFDYCPNCRQKIDWSDE